MPRSPILKRVERLHVDGGDAHGVEAADQVDLDHSLEIAERHRAVFADDAGRRARCRRNSPGCARRRAWPWPRRNRPRPRRRRRRRQRPHGRRSRPRPALAASRLTSNRVTLAPALASARAVPAPRPEPPPVTIAACPWICMKGVPWPVDLLIATAHSKWRRASLLRAIPRSSRAGWPKGRSRSRCRSMRRRSRSTTCRPPRCCSGSFAWCGPRSGWDDYLSKPLDLDELVVRVDRWFLRANRVRFSRTASVPSLS